MVRWISLSIRCGSPAVRSACHSVIGIGGGCGRWLLMVRGGDGRGLGLPGPEMADPVAQLLRVLLGPVGQARCLLSLRSTSDARATGALTADLARSRW